MARKFIKVGSTARFGARYGVKVRRQMKDVEDKLKAKHECPKCRHMSVKRRSTGIWECRHCGIVFAGGAYVPKPSEPTKLEEKIKEEMAERTADRKEKEKKGKAAPVEAKGGKGGEKEEE